LVVLEEDILFNGVTPCLDEVACVEDRGKSLVSANEFWFVGTLGIDFEFVGKTDCSTFAKGHHSSHVSAAILVSGMQGINPPLYSSEVVRGKVEFHVVHAMEVSEDSF
jgi:hypothetical protein